jgi:GcrA cell cycle regulator
MDWTDDVISRLRALWAEGHSTAEIGRRMGVSKNAVVGKAHRLALDARPSPIRRGAPGEAPKRPAAKRVVGPTLPTMATPAPSSASSPEPERVVVRPVLRPAPGQAPVLRAVNRTGGGRLVACCWPIGEPGTRSFRFCDDESLPGKPYCGPHAALAYVKIRDRREDAA